MTNLADYFREQAEWRDRKAEEYPDDMRNGRSAAALRSLAEFVDREPNLACVRALEPFEYGRGVLTGGEEVSRAVSRYGYENRRRWQAEAPPIPDTPIQHTAFLEQLLVLSLEDAYNHVREAASDSIDTLDALECAAARDDLDLGLYFSRREGLTVPEREAWVAESRAAAEQTEGDGV